MPKKTPKPPSTELVPAGLPSEITTQAQRTAQVLDLIKSQPCLTQEDLDWHDKALLKVETQLKALEAKRTGITKPINEAKRQVDALFAPWKDALKDCSALLRQKIHAALDAQRQTQYKALALVQETGGDVGEDTIAVAHGVENLEAPQGIRETSALTFVIEDETLVPAEYKRTSHELVMAEVLRSKGACKIPGIRVVREFSIARKGVVQK